MMNQAKRGLTDTFGNGPISATVQGAGRVNAYQSAIPESVAWPGSLSFGLDQVPGTVQETRKFSVRNHDNKSHRYNLSGSTRYSGFVADLATIALSTNGTSFSSTKSFNLGAGDKRSVWARLTLDPSGISEPEQEYGWYYIVENVDGDVKIDQTRNGPRDSLRLAWHVTPAKRCRHKRVSRRARLELGRRDAEHRGKRHGCVTRGRVPARSGGRG